MIPKDFRNPLTFPSVPKDLKVLELRSFLSNRRAANQAADSFFRVPQRFQVGISAYVVMVMDPLCMDPQTTIPKTKQKIRGNRRIILAIAIFFLWVV